MTEMRKAIEAAATTLTETDGEGSTVCTFRFDPDFPGFSGHFPGYPIVPAIVQVLAAQMLVESVHGAPLQLLSVESAKFLRQLLPGEEIRVVCRPKAGAAAVYQSKLSAGSETAATFLLRFDMERGQ